jgi:hypothetical protein
MQHDPQKHDTTKITSEKNLKQKLQGETWQKGTAEGRQTRCLSRQHWKFQHTTYCIRK